MICKCLRHRIHIPVQLLIIPDFQRDFFHNGLQLCRCLRFRLFFQNHILRTHLILDIFFLQLHLLRLLLRVQQIGKYRFQHKEGHTGDQPKNRCHARRQQRFFEQLSAVQRSFFYLFFDKLDILIRQILIRSVILHKYRFLSARLGTFQYTSSARLHTSAGKTFSGRKIFPRFLSLYGMIGVAACTTRQQHQSCVMILLCSILWNEYRCLLALCFEKRKELL